MTNNKPSEDLGQFPEMNIDLDEVSQAIENMDFSFLDSMKIDFSFLDTDTDNSREE